MPKNVQEERLRWVKPIIDKEKKLTERERLNTSTYEHRDYLENSEFY